MAFIQSNQNEEDKDKQLQPGQSGGSDGVLTPNGGGTSSPKNTPSKPQSFATLQSYLKVNKPQGEQLASQVAGNLSQTGTDARAGIEKTANDLNSGVSAQKVAYDPNVVKEAVAAPSDFVKDQNKVNQFNSFKNASYTGPKSAEETPEFQAATNNTNAALAKSKLADSESGRSQLLSDTQQNKATGITALNQALISTNPNAAATIKAAQQPFAGLTELLGSKAQDINKNIGEVSGNNAQAAADAQGMTVDKFNAVKQALQAKVTSTNADVRAKSAAIYQKLLKGQPLTDQDYLEIGASGQMQGGLDADSKYLKDVLGIDTNKMQYVQDKGISNNLTPEALASKEDYANEAALQKLLGNDYDFLPDDASKAGTADTRSQYGYDQSQQFKDNSEKINAAETAFLKDYSPVLGASAPQGDPKNKVAAEIYAAHYDKITPSQQAWYQAYIRGNPDFKPMRPQGGAAPKADPMAPPAPGESPTRVITDANGQGKFMWYQNGQWVPAPTEFRNMVNGGYTEQFNYKTGQYEPTGWTGGDGSGQPGPGVFKATVMPPNPTGSTPTPQVNPGISEPKPQVNPGITPPAVTPPPTTPKGSLGFGPTTYIDPKTGKKGLAY